MHIVLKRWSGKGLIKDVGRISYESGTVYCLKQCLTIANRLTFEKGIIYVKEVLAFWVADA